MDKYNFTEREKRILNSKIKSADSIINGVGNITSLIASLEPPLDDENFKYELLIEQWSKLWEPLEIYLALKLDKNEDPKKEDIINEIDDIRRFLNEQFEGTLK